jgi:hypothetical protein
VHTPTSTVMSALVALLLAVAAHGGDVPPVSALPDFYRYQQYNVEPYIRAAVALQSLDRATALRRLHEMAQDPNADARVIVLCRMLFAPRLGGEFRGPLIGGALFLRDTSYSDWPLEPIEILDGIPFLVVTGYILAGQPEADKVYLRYAETHADWSTVRYTLKTAEQKREALEKFLASPKWKQPLDASDRKFLMDQVQ